MTPECTHIKSSGQKCGAVALHGQSYCYFHAPARPQARSCPGVSAPLSEDLADLSTPEAIRRSIAAVTRAISENRLEPKRARILLYGLGIALGNLRRINPAQPSKAQSKHG